MLHEWNDHLERFSRPQAIENSRKYLFLGRDILQKTIEPLFSVMVLLRGALDAYWSLRLGL